LLANIYLNGFDQEKTHRGVKAICCADVIFVLAKSKLALEHLLDSSRKLLEGKLKLTMNAQKSKMASVVAQKNFKFLVFCLGKSGKGIYIRAYR
jgi:hypothetical protein